MRRLLVMTAVLAVVIIALWKKNDVKPAPVVTVEQVIPEKIHEVSIPVVSEAQSVSIPEKDPLQKMGFAPDSEIPGQMKKTVTVNGKVSVYSIASGSSFSPKDKSVAAAVELLDRRNSENPEEELLNLKPLDFKNDDEAMLSGKFRDDANDLEFRLSEVEPDSNVPASQDFICLMAPKLKLKMRSLSPKHLIRSDSTGYGVVRFEGGIYARLMWSFEDKRIIHGQIIKIDGNLPRVLLQFNAVEKSALRGEELEYCR